MATPSRSLKILLIGDAKTGKQSYVTRLIKNKFPNDAWTNVSISFFFFVTKFLFMNNIYYRNNVLFRQWNSKLMKILKFQ